MKHACNSIAGEAEVGGSSLESAEALWHPVSKNH